jgi:PAS domain-containing protein
VDLVLALGMVVTATLVALAGLVAMSALLPQGTVRPASIFAGQTPGTVFLFDGEALVDATPPARAMIDSVLESGGPWFRTLTRLEPIFPGLTARLDGLSREGRFLLASRSGMTPALSLCAEHLGGLTRLTLREADSALARGDAAAESALLDELGALRETLAQAPLPVWREAADGQVIWANTEYLRLLSLLSPPGKELAWPLARLFGPETAAGKTSARRRLMLPDGPRHFEIASIPAEGQQQFYAFPAEAVVLAETTLAEFKQTLTKTFAQLPIGLAVFDGNRVLQMFNPALIDLTGLPVETLIARPTLSAVLDAMRERQMIPEPRDYRSWRRQIVEMEAAAASGLFQDTWTLPKGQTYRITGRPHPNGALAFMIEDISTEMTRTRRYRAELELAQSVIDALPEAVAVFAQDGSLVQSNPALRDLWSNDGPLPFDDSSGALAHWRAASAPTLLWTDMAASIGAFGPREGWSGEARLADGRLVDCRVVPLPQGSTLVSFRLVPPRPEALGADGLREAVLIA